MGIFFINIIHGTWLPTTSTLVPALNMIINIIHGVTARPQHDIGCRRGVDF